MFVPKKLTSEQAFQKLRHFCSYQERSHQEVLEKIYSFGIYKSDAEVLITQLIEENYLNEERFAIAFVGGKFRIKHWGRKKIEYELKQKKVSTYCIKKALKTIDEADYLQTLQSLVNKKWESLKAEQYLNRQAKTMAYLSQKGFEPSLIAAAINAVRNK
ncbi:MAG: regulatory protein RecX [Chitinophagaceae bacterium]